MDIANTRSLILEQNKKEQTLIDRRSNGSTAIRIAQPELGLEQAVSSRSWDPYVVWQDLIKR